MTINLEEILRAHMHTRGLNLPPLNLAREGWFRIALRMFLVHRNIFPAVLSLIPMKPRPVCLVFRGPHLIHMVP